MKREAIRFLNEEEMKRTSRTGSLNKWTESILLSTLVCIILICIRGIQKRQKEKLHFILHFRISFVAIFPEDFKEEGFDRLARILQKAKIRVKDSVPLAPPEVC